MTIKTLICIFTIWWSARNTFANETVAGNKQASKYSTNETDTNHVFIISTLNQRFDINQAQEAKCRINSSIDDFPIDIFTNEQRQHGAILLHLLGAIYFFTLLAVVCNDYFLPSVECICEDLNISKYETKFNITRVKDALTLNIISLFCFLCTILKDVAAATFMATATTTPEFFTNAISTFVMDSNMGLGTIIGSLMFNTLGVAAIAGLASVKPVKLEWWPITRDCILFSLNLLILIWFSWDSKITLLESIVLVILYFLYFVILFQNNRIMKCVMKAVEKATDNYTRKSYDLPSSNQLKITQAKCGVNNQSNDNNNQTETMNKQNRNNGLTHLMEIYHIYDQPETEIVNRDDDSSKQQAIESKKIEKSLWTRPISKGLKIFWWFYTWPIKLLLTLTIPNPKTWRRLYPLTFALCVAWIGANAYLIVWMITVIGFTYSIPESVMGLTFLAAGGCMPEAISSVIMIRKGEGGIGVSNSLGANSLAILMSLGVPWLVRNIIYRNTSENSFVSVGSAGIQYTIMSLLVAIILLYAVLSIAKYSLNKRVGLSLITIYLVFLTVGVLFELGIIFSSGQCL